MELTIDNIRLRKPQPEDAAALAKAANNKKVARNLRDGFPSPYKLQDAKEFIQKCIDENLTNFSIFHNDVFCGLIGLTITQDACLTRVEMGYWLGEAHWGKGIATKAVRLVSEYGLKQLGHEKIVAVVLEYNPGSMRVLEKAGYTFKGYTKETGSKHGVPHDEYHYEITS